MNFPINNEDIPYSSSPELRYLSVLQSYDERINILYNYCKIGYLKGIIDEKYTLEEIRSRNNNALRIAGIFGHLHIIKYFIDNINLRLEDIKNSDVIYLTKNQQVKDILNTYIDQVEDVRYQNDLVRSYISKSSKKKHRRSCI